MTNILKKITKIAGMLLLVILLGAAITFGVSEVIDANLNQ